MAARGVRPLRFAALGVIREGTNGGVGGGRRLCLPSASHATSWPQNATGAVDDSNDDTILFPAGKEGTSLPHGSPQLATDIVGIPCDANRAPERSQLGLSGES